LKKKTILFASLMVILATQPSTTMALDLLDCLTPYVGMNVGWRHQGFAEAFGGNLVSKNYPEGNVYLGMKYQDYLGIQLGFDATSKKQRTSKFTAPYIAFGLFTDAHFDELKASTRIYGWHIDLLGFIPICLNNEQYHIISSIGVSKKRFKLKVFNTISGAEILNGSDVEESTRDFFSTQCMARVALGLQYMMTQCTGIRIMGNWENTSKFKNLATQNNQEGMGRVTLRKAFTVNFGVSYYF